MGDYEISIAKTQRDWTSTNEPGRFGENNQANP
jgi:hypothetical protein